MGWDAFSTPWDDEKFHYNPLTGFREGTQDPAYEEAAKDVKRRCGTVDGFLSSGGLDCSACAHALERALERFTGGLSVCWAEDWDPETVKKFAEIADWNFTLPPGGQLGERNCWAKESAKAFLEVTAKLGRGVKFSW